MSRLRRSESASTCIFGHNWTGLCSKLCGNSGRFAKLDCGKVAVDGPRCGPIYLATQLELLASEKAAAYCAMVWYYLGAMADNTLRSLMGLSAALTLTRSYHKYGQVPMAQVFGLVPQNN